jgi:hypothetical protein
VLSVLLAQDNADLPTGRDVVEISVAAEWAN